MNTEILCAVLAILSANTFAADVTFTRITNGPVASGVSGTAAAWGDYNNDGWVDLYVTTFNGSAYLYRNNGGGTFTSITGVPISAGGVNSFGCAWADYDNDGHLDLLQGGYNLPSRLFHNNGDGTFSQITTGTMAGIDRGANNVLWGDYDNDGFIDLFIAISFNAPQNVLYHNHGNGTFAKVTNSPPVNTPGNSQGAAWGDYDNDGQLDLVVNHTGTRSQLFHNSGHGVLIEITNSSVSEASSEIYGGASWGDYDNDGVLDLFVTSFGFHSALYHNNGDGTFTRITNSPIYQPTAKSTGGAWADYDNDGYLDLFVANDNSTSFLYHNNGDGTFTAVTNGSVVTDIGRAQGACWGDYDNNGFPDLFLPNIFTFNNFLYRNDGNSNAWLTLRLEGRSSNQAGIGAKVRVKAVIAGQTVWQLREISGGGSLGSQNDLRAAFGLGDATNAEVVRVEWPSGLVQQLTNVSARQFLTLVEPSASISPAALFLPAGTNATFTLQTDLGPTIQRQWNLNGVALTGETNATLNITNVQSTNAGNYTVSLTDSASGLSFSTRAAMLAGPVVISQPPGSQNIRLSSNVTFSVVATGFPPLTIQWQRNGTNLSGATNSVLSLTNVQVADEDAYGAIVSNSYGTQPSSNATLTVLIKPVINVQPLAQSVVAGGSVTLSASATGHPFPLTFRWLKNGSPISVITVEDTNCFLTITNIQPTSPSQPTYRLIVTNLAGTVNSANAVLTVLADTDGDGIPDDWETAHGLDFNNPADATLDNDADGLTNLAEYRAGTDPNDAQSKLKLELVAAGNSNALLRFFAASNHVYKLQERTAVDVGAWSSAAIFPALPTNRWIESRPLTLTNSAQKFFRLQAP